MKKLLLPLTALGLIFSTHSFAQDEDMGGGGFGDFAFSYDNGDLGRTAEGSDQNKSSNLIYTKGLTIQTKKPVAIEQFIEILESKDSGIGQKINVFIEPKAAGTLLAPVNVRNVSAYTLLKTIAPHANLEVDIIRSNTPKLEGIVEIRAKKKQNNSSILFDEATKDDVLNPKPAEHPTDKAPSPLYETSQSPKALPAAQSNNTPSRAIPIKAGFTQLSVIPLGKLNPLRWDRHVIFLTEILQTQAQIEPNSGCQFHQVGQLLILRQPSGKLKQAELIANAYLTSMTEIERQADTLIASLKKEIYSVESELSKLDDNINKSEAQALEQELDRLHSKLVKIEHEHGLR